MTGIKIALVGSSLGLFSVAVTDPIAIGGTAEKLGIVGILAALIVILVIAVVWLYRDGGKRQDKLECLIGKVEVAITRNSDVTERTARIIEKCEGRK